MLSSNASKGNFRLCPLRDKHDSHARWAEHPNGDIVVFIHGFLGHSLATWQQFPDLIQNDVLEHADVVFLGYDTKFTLADALFNNVYGRIATLVNEPFRYNGYPRINRNEFFFRRLFIVGHSFGGVLARRILLTALKNRDFSVDQIRVGLFAPAHHGMARPAIAKLTLLTSILGQGSVPMMEIIYPLIHDLLPNSRFLNDLKDEANQAGAEKAISAASIPSFIAFGVNDTYVPQHRFAVDKHPPICISGRDHIDICKPDSNFSEPVELLKGLIT